MCWAREATEDMKMHSAQEERQATLKEPWKHCEKHSVGLGRAGTRAQGRGGIQGRLPGGSGERFSKHRICCSWIGEEINGADLSRDGEVGRSLQPSSGKSCLTGTPSMDGMGPTVDGVRCCPQINPFLGYLVNELRRCGFSVVTAFCGRVALSCNALCRAYDLVFSDCSASRLKSQIHIYSSHKLPL